MAATSCGPTIFRSKARSCGASPLWAAARASSSSSCRHPSPRSPSIPTPSREWLGRVPALRLDGKRPTVAELQIAPRLVLAARPGHPVHRLQPEVRRGPLQPACTRPRSASAARSRPATGSRHCATSTRPASGGPPPADPELYEDTLLEAFVKASGRSAVRSPWCSRAASAASTASWPHSTTTRRRGP